MTLRSYILGFLLSVLLTLFAFWYAPTLPHAFVYVAFITAAILQLFVQLLFFLHLRDPKHRDNALALIYTVFIMAILVGGTLWIMHNLALRVMPQYGPEGTFLNGVVTPKNELD